jgi:hypothetical protein
LPYSRRSQQAKGSVEVDYIHAVLVVVSLFMFYVVDWSCHLDQVVGLWVVKILRASSESLLN